MREDIRELRAAMNNHSADIVILKTNIAVLLDFMAETRARNHALPGWLLAAAGLLLPLIGSIATMWIAGKIP